MGQGSLKKLTQDTLSKKKKKKKRGQEGAGKFRGLVRDNFPDYGGEALLMEEKEGVNEEGDICKKKLGGKIIPS